MECYQVEHYSNLAAWPIVYHASREEVEFYIDLAKDFREELEKLSGHAPHRYFPAFDVDCRAAYEASNQTLNQLDMKYSGSSSHLST